MPKFPKNTGFRMKSPLGHNLPGLQHTKPKIHGEFKQPHVHGADPRNPDATNKANPTKVKRKVYRKSKKNK